jgi:hypothetical protein
MLEIVRTIELNVDMGGDNAPLRLRIEVLREVHDQPAYYARLCRWESFKMRPWPSESGAEDSVEEVLIEDAFWDWKRNPAPSAKSALDSILARLSAQIPGLSFERDTGPGGT